MIFLSAVYFGIIFPALLMACTVSPVSGNSVSLSVSGVQWDFFNLKQMFQACSAVPRGLATHWRLRRALVAQRASWKCSEGLPLLVWSYTVYLFLKIIVRPFCAYHTAPARLYSFLLFFLRSPVKPMLFQQPGDNSTDNNSCWRYYCCCCCCCGLELCYPPTMPP